MTRLTDKVRMLFDGKNFAVLSTLEPDGRPHSTVTWVKRDADDVLFALPESRRKTANLIRDPRFRAPNASGSGRPSRPASSIRAADPSESGEPPRPRRPRPRPRAPLGPASQPPHAGQTPPSGPR
jgi:hypothetical protein